MEKTKNENDLGLKIWFWKLIREKIKYCNIQGENSVIRKVLSIS